MQKPNLVIQLHRLGDLVLSFPLFSWLMQADEGRPLWVVAEPSFFQGLMPLSPSAVYFPPTALPQLQRNSFERVINLSHSPEAALMAGFLQTDSRYGLYTLPDSQGTHVGGAWHLYRTSLTHNNRHNLFHWADLNALDLVGSGVAGGGFNQPDMLLRTAWPKPNPGKKSGRIGLFVGASQPEKRPGPEFWGDLAMALAKRGYKPVFLGGKAERSLAFQAARHAGMIHSNLCEQFTLTQLVDFMRELDMLVAPDTGPMHVGAWAGIPVLNLSLGPVSAWETGPFPPGHHILRPACSCSGCWQCFQELPPCHKLFQPQRIASLMHRLLQGKNEKMPLLPGLQLSVTRRVRQGLFDLLPCDGRPYMTQRRALDDFWQQYFLMRLGGPESQLDTALQRLERRFPHTLSMLRQHMPQLSRPLAQGLRHGTALPQEYWHSPIPLLRPLSSFVQTMLENANYSTPAWRAALEHVAFLEDCLKQ